MGPVEKYILIPILGLMFVAFMLNHRQKRKTRSARTVNRNQPLFTGKSSELRKKMQKEKLFVVAVLGVAALLYDWLVGF